MSILGVLKNIIGFGGRRGHKKHKGRVVKVHHKRTRARRRRC